MASLDHESGTMPTKVEEFLAQQGSKRSEVPQKPIEVEVDLGNLAAFDTNAFQSNFRQKKEASLLQLTTENMQLLMNKLYELPQENVDNVNVVKLPEPTTRLPREKKVPKPREPTKWEKYAALKGIPKKKKGRMLWDNDAQQYRPRFGYKSKGNQKDWVLEVPENADPNEDLFAKKKKEKQERVAKNELQRLRNIARATKSKVPGVGLTPTDAPSKDALGKALAITHKSTASLGKFMQTLPKEKIKNLGKKRKYDSLDSKDDLERQKKIAKRIADGIPIINTNKAANDALHREQLERAQANRDEGGGKKGNWKKGKKGGGGGGKKGGGKGGGGKGGGGKGGGGKGGGKDFGGKNKKQQGKQRRKK